MERGNRARPRLGSRAGSLQGQGRGRGEDRRARWVPKASPRSGSPGRGEARSQLFLGPGNAAGEAAAIPSELLPGASAGGLRRSSPHSQEMHCDLLRETHLGTKDRHRVSHARFIGSQEPTQEVCVWGGGTSCKIHSLQATVFDLPRSFLGLPQATPPAAPIGPWPLAEDCRMVMQPQPRARQSSVTRAGDPGVPPSLSDLRTCCLWVYLQGNSSIKLKNLGPQQHPPFYPSRKA